MLPEVHVNVDKNVSLGHDALKIRFVLGSLELGIRNCASYKRGPTTIYFK